MATSLNLGTKKHLQKIKKLTTYIQLCIKLIIHQAKEKLKYY